VARARRRRVQALVPPHLRTGLPLQVPYGSPPLLGIVSNCIKNGATLARFVHTCSFRPPRAERINWLALDCWNRAPRIELGDGATPVGGVRGD